MEQEKTEQTHYQKYKDSIIEARRRWIQRGNNRQNVYDYVRTRNAMFQAAYNKLKELENEGQIEKQNLEFQRYGKYQDDPRFN